MARFGRSFPIPRVRQRGPVGVVDQLPYFLSWAIDGSSLVGTASEALDATFAASPAKHTVKVNGISRAVNSVVVSGLTATLTLSSAAVDTDVVTVSGAP